MPKIPKKGKEPEGGSEKKYTYFRKTARIGGRKLEATGKTEREALLKLAEKIEAVKRGEETVNGNMTVDSWFREWIETFKEPQGITQKSLGMYTEKYRLYIKPFIGHLKLKDITDVKLQKVLNAQSGYSSSSAKKVRMVLREIFRQARRSRLILYDPSECLTLPTVTEGKRRSITEDERALILKVADESKYGLWVLTLLFTGIRPGESAALRWKDIDFKKCEIHVHAAVESGTHNIKEPKTPSGIRDIPIHKYLYPRLKAACGEPDDLVFPGYAGKPADLRNTQRWWNYFKNSMDIENGAETYRNKIIQSTLAPDLVLYCLRHTFCTDLQRAGVPLNIAKELMGHSSISVTADIYTHRDTATLHSSIEMLESMMLSDQNPAVETPVEKT